jgi:septal ring factor EnvC (AmiA/AmiB activator)
LEVQVAENVDEKNPKGEGGGNDTPPAPPSGNDGGNDGKTVTMTQEALDRLFQERADRAERSKEKSILEVLGVENIEDVQETLKEYKDWKDSQKDELEKLQDDLSEAYDQIASLKQQLTEAQSGLATFKTRVAVVDAAREDSFLKESWDDIWLLATNDVKLNKMLEIDDESGDVKGADKVVKEIAKMRPHWLEQEQRRGAPSGRRAAATNAPAKPPVDGQPSPKEEPLVRM